MSSTLHLYDTLQRTLVPFIPRDPSRITFYSCGPTVYDDAHIGNFRSFLAADVLRRFLESPLCRLNNDGTAGGLAPAAPQHASQSRPTARTVVHVMNITDVGHMTDDDNADGAGEDKMAAAARRLLDAKKSGKLPPGAGDIDPTDQRSIARFYEQRFKEDARRLGLKVALDADPASGGDPTLMPRATESVPAMIAVVARLIASGHAYAVGPAARQTVYFSVQSFPAYGRLSGNTLDALRSGGGGRIQESHQAEKRHPADFLLWKSDPAHAMRWPSPWGEGYPGWHIECSAMSAARLRSPHALTGTGAKTLTPDELAAFLVENSKPIIDLHSGGEDNIFPHHECEIAQSCCAFNATPGAGDPDHALYAAHWFHPRFLMVEGAKMSKSKGNFYTPRDLIAKGHDPAAIRLELIKTHYRSNANFTEQGLRDSARMVERWRARLDACASAIGFANSNALSDLRKEVNDGTSSFAAVLHDDLNIHMAIVILSGTIDRAHSSLFPLGADPDDTKSTHGWHEIVQRVRDAYAQDTNGSGYLMRIIEMLAVIGVTDCGDPASKGEEVPATVLALLEQRRAARAAKDFKQSDAIRDQLAAMGYAIKDAPGGKVEVRRAAPAPSPRP